MRAAQLLNDVVINYAEVIEFDGIQFVDPTGSLIGSTWNGTYFGQPIPFTLTPVQLESAIQSQLDTLAQSWGYDDMATACTYVGDPCAKFNAEATALRAWRSATWQAAESLDAQILAGTVAMPATVADALALTPAAPARPA